MASLRIEYINWQFNEHSTFPLLNYIYMNTLISMVEQETVTSQCPKLSG